MITFVNNQKTLKKEHYIMIKQLLIFIFICSSFSTITQLSSNEINDLYKRITISKNQFSSEEVAQHLEKIEVTIRSSSLSVEDRLKSHLIKANLYKFQGNRIQALQSAEDGQDLAANKKEYIWQARFLGFISTEYRQLNMLELSHEKLVEAIKISEKAPDSDELFRFKHNAYHEMAYQAEFNDNSNDALHYIKQSAHWAQKIKDKRGFFSLASDYQYIGILFNKLKQPDSAIFYFNQSIMVVDTQQIDINTQTLKNFIYTGLGKSYLFKKDFANSKHFFTKVLNDSSKYRTLELDQELYSNLTEYYQSIGNLDSLSLYRKKLDSISIIVNQTKSKAINAVTHSLNVKSQNSEKSKHAYIYVFIGSIVVILVFVFLFIRKKNQKYAVKYKQIIDRLEKEEIQQKNNYTEDKQSIDITPSQETENKILKKMALFEKSERFLKKDLSVGYLSSNWDTNPKYLSQIIQKHKKQNFNTYINKLRINFITHKLYNEPEYRKYKINYLADVAGYASPQVFVIAFKKENGMTPSQFINELRKEETEIV